VRRVRAVLLCTEDFEVFTAVEAAFAHEPRWQDVALLTDRREARKYDVLQCVCCSVLQMCRGVLQFVAV